jgi:hypothetical protein
MALRAPLLLLLLAAPATAAAQARPEPADGPADEARADFQRGIAALEDGRFTDALAAFDRSYEARRVASVALNLGVTLRALGRLREARQRFRDFLALASPQQHARHDVEVVAYLAAIERQVGRVRVSGIDLGDTVLRVNQHRERLDGRGETEIDPGDHLLTIESAGYEPVQRTVHVEAGETAEVPVVPTRPAGWIFTRWWFWTSLALVAGAGITAGVLCSQSPTDPPTTSAGLTISLGGSR